MSIKQYVYILLLVFLSHANSWSQSMIGRPCPDLPLKGVVNGILKERSIKDFVGAPLILEYWATWCAPCVAGLPKMDSFRRQFKDVQVLMVTSDKTEKVREFFKENKIGKIVGIPSFTADTEIKKTFRFALYPNVIWIDKYGIVQAVTDATPVTKQNIKAFAAGEKLNLTEKKDVLNFNVLGSIPLIFNNYDSNKSRLLTYSYFSTYQSGIVGLTSSPRKTGSLIRCRMTNADICLLYKVAFNVDFTWSDGRVLHEYTNPGNYKRNFDTKENLYCYDLFVKGTDSIALAKAYAYMKSDLDRFFNVTGKREKRKVKCLILKRTSATDKLGSKGGKLEYNLTDHQMSVTNVPLASVFSKYLGRTFEIILDETGFTGPVDMSFDFGKKNITLESVREALKKYDLDLVEEVREVELIVLK